MALSIYGEYESSSSGTKLPTLRQYLKGLGKRNLPKQFMVLVIWTPGEWDNYTLQSEHWRLRIDSNHPTYKLLSADIEQLTKSDSTFAVSITDRKTGAFKIVECNERGSWMELGTNGYKFDNT